MWKAKDCGIDGGEQNLSFVDRWLLGRLQIAKRDIAEGLTATALISP